MPYPLTYLAFSAAAKAAEQWERRYIKLGMAADLLRQGDRPSPTSSLPQHRRIRNNFVGKNHKACDNKTGSVTTADHETQ